MPNGYRTNTFLSAETLFGFLSYLPIPFFLPFSLLLPLQSFSSLVLIIFLWLCSVLSISAYSVCSHFLFVIIILLLYFYFTEIFQFLQMTCINPLFQLKNCLNNDDSRFSPNILLTQSSRASYLIKYTLYEHKRI